jgi:diacylglycerol kinase (ATP)
MTERAFVIANPAAGGGRVASMLPGIVARVRAQLGSCELLRTERIGHGEERAAEAIRAGAAWVFSLGGDGTHGEVARGIFGAEKGSANARVVFLSGGTGGDFCRLLEGGRGLDAMLDDVRALPEARIDLGVAEVVGDDGAPASRVFLNMAGSGAAPLVVREVAASQKTLGGQLTFLLATLSVLRSYDAPRVRVFVDGRDEGAFLVNALTASNGRFAGGGMMFSPNAKLTDGKLDVTLIEDDSLLASLAMAPALYRGGHLGHRRVHVFQGEEIRFVPDSNVPAMLEFDGEPFGRAPVTFTTARRALRVMGLREDVL